MAATLLICIGTQKAGTTWLWDYLRANPEIHTPPVKEVHYFDARYSPKWCAKYEEEMLENFKREVARLTLQESADPAVQQKLAAMLLRFRMVSNPQEYLRFMQWGAGAKKVLFDATPDYAMLGREGFEAMRSMHNDVRLIFLMRNPADRFWSSLRFNKTHVPEFDIDVMFDRLIEREDFRLLSDYGRTILAARAAVGPERLHIEFYERLFDPEAARRICAFAGVPFTAPDIAARSNASDPGEMPPARRLQAVRAYARTYREVAALFSGEIPESWLEDLKAI